MTAFNDYWSPREKFCWLRDNSVLVLKKNMTKEEKENYSSFYHSLMEAEKYIEYETAETYDDED